MAKFRFHKIAAVAVLIGFAAWMGTGKFSSVGSAAAEADDAPAGQATPEQPKPAAEAPQAAPRTVAVIQPPRTSHARAIRLSGQTEADKRAVLGTRSAGIIRELPIDEGQAIKAGDLVLALDAEDKPAMVELAKQVVKQREAELVASQRLTLPAAGPDNSITQGSHDQPYTIPNYRVTGIKAPLSVPVSFWRSVGCSQNGFFHECFMDELAAAGKVDPLDLRRKLMAEYPAAIAVVDKVAEMSNWAEKLPAGRAKGFAFTLSFGSWCGQVIQVAETPDGIKLEKMWIAVDVGTALDPSIIEAQMFSGAILGLSAAMGQAITFKGGMVEQSNFHDFDAMRISQSPSFDIAVLENYHKMGGVGEVGVPPAAPALANAIFALTGKRIRSLPLSDEVRFA